MTVHLHCYSLRNARSHHIPYRRSSKVVRNLSNQAAFLRKLLKELHYVPRKLVTDKLASYGAARREILSRVLHCQGSRQNNRAEVSHQSTWQRKRHMRRFKSPRHAQRFLAVHGPSTPSFVVVDIC